MRRMEVNLGSSCTGNLDVRCLEDGQKYARTRIRTEDLMITSHALYQLSHAS